jgi:hypothetical protein
VTSFREGRLRKYLCSFLMKFLDHVGDFLSNFINRSNIGSTGSNPASDRDMYSRISVSCT